MLNLARRHLEGYQWGGGFKMLLEAKGIERKAGRPSANAATVAGLSASVRRPGEVLPWRLAPAARPVTPRLRLSQLYRYRGASVRGGLSFAAVGAQSPFSAVRASRS